MEESSGGQSRYTKSRFPSPFAYWPIIRLRSILKRIPFHITMAELVRICRKNRIRYRVHPKLGYILNPDSTMRLMRVIQVMNHPYPIDRISILLWMTGLDDPDPRKMPRFSEQLEKEIMRITRLPDPMRTEQAVRMVLRWRDAEAVAKVLVSASKEDVEQQAKWHQDRKEKDRLQGQMMRLAGLEGQEDIVLGDEGRLVTNRNLLTAAVGESGARTSTNGAGMEGKAKRKKRKPTRRR